jgi:4-hydroxy-3-polyprenylbenzoate decarboxylase
MSEKNGKERIIVGVSGASGVVMGYRLLKVLGEFPEIERHLVVTTGAKEIWSLETALGFETLTGSAEAVHAENNFAADISSGSFQTSGMIVIPCSMKSLAGIASGYTDNLLLRAVDVCLKENRRVVLVPREMPLGKVHLRNLLQVAELGCAIVPPMLTFYNSCETVEKQIDHIIGKILMQFGLQYKAFVPWKENRR